MTVTVQDTIIRPNPSLLPDGGHMLVTGVIATNHPSSFLVASACPGKFGATSVADADSFVALVLFAASVTVRVNGMD